MTTTELTAKVKALKELETLIKQAQEEAEAIKDALKSFMQDCGVDEMNVDVYTVRNKVVNSSRLDGKALFAELPDIAKRYTVSTSCVRFSVA